MARIKKAQTGGVSKPSKHVGPVDPDGAWTKVQERNLPPKNVKASAPKAKGGKWIQKATASIKRRGTEGVCKGSKFGGPTCKPGSRRYNLAKTFRKMAKSK